MKKLSLNQMEQIQGGQRRDDFLDGACAVLGGLDVAIGVRLVMGTTLAIPGWGQAVLVGGSLACLGRHWKIW